MCVWGWREDHRIAKYPLKAQLLQGVYMKFSSTLSKHNDKGKVNDIIISPKCLNFKIIFQNFIGVWNTGKLPVHRREGHICKHFVNNNIVPNWVAFMRCCLMVWIMIIFSEIFWSKWLLENSNLMFACLSGFSK